MNKRRIAVGLGILVVVIIIIVFVCVFGTVGLVAKVGHMPPSSYLTKEGLREQESSVYDWRSRLYMTYYDKKRIPKHVWDLFDRVASGYDVIVHDDTDAEAWLQKWYTPAVVRKFHALKGPHRADLIRFCWLYVKGGIYLDIKTIPLKHLQQIFDDRVVAVDSDFTSGHIGILNGPPKTFLYGRMIDIIVRTPVSIMYYLRFVDSFIREALPEAKKLGADIMMLHEKCDCKVYPQIGKDKYGFCCGIFDDNGEMIMHVRDPAYPY